MAQHLDIDPASKAFGDVASLAIVAGSLVEMLPALAAGISIVWTCLRIYEMKTVQRWLEQRRKKEGKT